MTQIDIIKVDAKERAYCQREQALYGMLLFDRSVEGKIEEKRHKRLSVKLDQWESLLRERSVEHV